jgi:hypothetical protein
MRQVDDSKYPVWRYCLSAGVIRIVTANRARQAMASIVEMEKRRTDVELSAFCDEFDGTRTRVFVVVAKKINSELMFEAAADLSYNFRRVKIVIISEVAW